MQLAIKEDYYVNNQLVSTMIKSLLMRDRQLYKYPWQQYNISKKKWDGCVLEPLLSTLVSRK